MTSHSDQYADDFTARVDLLIAKYEKELHGYEEERADYIRRSKGRMEKKMVEARKEVSVLLLMTQELLRDLRALKLP